MSNSEKEHLQGFQNWQWMIMTFANSSSRECRLPATLRFLGILTFNIRNMAWGEHDRQISALCSKPQDRAIGGFATYANRV